MNTSNFNRRNGPGTRTVCGKLFLGRGQSTVSSVAVLMLAGVLSANVSAQTAIVPRVPKLVMTAPVISGNALPSGTGTTLAYGSSTQNPIYAPTVEAGQFGAYTVDQNKNIATITETSNAGILAWNSFDIGSGSTINIVQPSATSILLNRVNGSVSQSMINGVLNANGTVYLYNPNGIIFGKNALVNVGSLVATSLNVNDNLFLQGILSPVTAPNFAADPTLTTAPGDILIDGDSGSRARLTSANGGKILMFAPNVTNNGIVTAPDGQVILAGGGEVFLAAPSDTSMRGLFVAVNSSNLPQGTTTSVTNNGTVAVGRGNATLVGLAVNQNGIVSAQTSANINGSIYLLAQDGAARNGFGKASPDVGGTLTLGSGSTTAITILDDGSTATQGPTDSAFKTSQIVLSGQTVNLQGSAGSLQGAQVTATGGKVTINATSNADVPSFLADGSSVTLGAGSVIDVSGDTSAVLPMSSNVISVQLLSELANNLPLRNSTIRGQTLNFDIRSGTTIADISADLAKIPYTVGQLAATGGSVAINSNGTLVEQGGSTINVSGGKVNYSAGYLNTSFLKSGGALFSDSNAPSNRTYTGMVNLPDGRWDYQLGYFDGKSAGTITLAAPQLALQGNLIGTATPGQLQRDVSAGNRPLGGQLIIGVNPGTLNDSLATTQFGFIGNLVFDNSATMPPVTDVATTLASNQLDLNVDTLAAGGFTRIASFNGGNVTVAGPIALGAGGSLSLNALGNVTFNAGVSIPGGSVSAKTPFETLIAPNATFDLAGTWRNDSRLANPSLNANGVPTGDIVNKGGSFSIDANQIVIGDKVTIDVSGGAWYSNSNKLTSGTGGNISMVVDNTINSTTQLDAISIGSGLTLESYGLSKGGSLSLLATNVQIGSSPAVSTDATGSTLLLPSGLFSSGGFSGYSINGLYNLSVNAGTMIDAVAQNWIFTNPNNWKGQQSGAMTSVATPGLLNLTGPQGGRKPVSITLSATGYDAQTKLAGSIMFGAGSTLQTDPGGSVTLAAGQVIDVEGTINVPAGNISIALESSGYDPTRAVWIGADAHLFARGTTDLLYTNGNGTVTGEVLGGGSVSIASDNGYMVVEQQSAGGQQGGASIDVCGVASAPVTLAGRGGNKAAAIASAGGNISISAREGILFDGSALGQPGNSTQQGGSLSLSLVRPDGNPVTGYPDLTPYALNIVDGPIVSHLPAGITPGAPIVGVEDQGWINTASFNNGGFSQLSFKSHDAINISSATSGAALNARSAVYLDAPVLEFSNGVSASAPLTDVQINSAYVQLGNTDFQNQNNPTANVLNNVNNNYFSSLASAQNYAAQDGAVTLNVNATTIDLVGSIVVQGVHNTILNATQDIRLTGISKQDLTVGPTPNFIPSLAQLMPTGEFSVAGNLTLNSAQVYPTTLSSFALDAEGANSTLNFVSNGSKPYSPLSAAGSLFAFAQTINQSGVVAAPFGTIDFVAGSQLTYAKGSTTTVAGSGVIPFGQIINGRDWAYDFGNGNEVLFELNPSANSSSYPATTLPQKTVIASAPAISTEAGATISLAGGGQLYGYEFTPGSYGTADVLKNNTKGSQTSVFAVLPGYSNAVAPREYQYGQDGGLQPGESVYLSGIAGLPAGNYVLLPAHYALLPGAFAVTLTTTGRDVAAAQNVINLNGSYSVAGNVNVQGNGDSRTYTYTVTPGTVVRLESQYQEYSATSFFTSAAQSAGLSVPVLPVDGGHLEFNAGASLTLDGQFELGGATGGVNGMVDISAPAIEVVSAAAQPVPQGTVELVAGNLTGLSADSLLLGGLRSVSGSTTNISVGAQSVSVNNDANNPLSGTEIILAAQQNVSLAAGAVVQATGKALASGNSLTILGTDPNGTAVGTDGALLRVSTGPAVAVTRVAPSHAQGALTIGQGATIGASGSAYLDSTVSTVNQGNLNLQSGAALGLSAPRISLGDAIPVNSNGLQLNTAALNNLDTLSSLTLNSYSTIDLYGNVNLGNAAMHSLTLSSGGLQGNYAAGAPGDVSFTAQSVQLYGTGVFTPGGTVAAGSAGTLTISAGNISIGNGNFNAGGYANVNLNATGGVSGVGSGAMQVDSNLSVTAGVITGKNGSNFTFGAGQNIVLAQAANAQLPSASLQSGGSIGFSAGAGTIESNVNIDVPSGTITMNAANGVSLTGGTLSAAGLARTFGTTTAYAPAGSISINGGTGNVTLGTGATIDVSAVGASAGQLTIAAAGSASSNFVLNGVVKGSAAVGVDGSQQNQGSFSLDVGMQSSATQFDQLADTISQSGFNGSQNYRVRNGDVSLDAGNTITAQHVRVAADNGSLNIGGTVDASGRAGGTINLYASQVSSAGQSGNVNLLAGSVLNASATGTAISTTQSTAGSTGTGGTVVIGTGSADGQMAAGLNGGSVIQFAANAVIDVHGNSQETNGDANGTVTFRAPQIVGGNDVAIAGLNGNIVGSKLNTVEGYKVYTAVGYLGYNSDGKQVYTAPTISSAIDSKNPDGTYKNLQAATTTGGVPTGGQMYIDAAKFGNGGAAAALAARSNPSLTFSVSPGIQVASPIIPVLSNGIQGVSTGDLTVSVNEGSSTPQNRGWNLDAWHFNNAPVNLTLLAAGNLKINGSISDGFKKPTSGSTAMPDWTLDTNNSGSFTLVGGADLLAANPMAVVAGANSGDVQFNFGTPTYRTGYNTPVALVRTGTGTIKVAAGRDVVLGTMVNSTDPTVFDPTKTLSAAIYTAGKVTSYDGSLGAFNAPIDALNTQYTSTTAKPAAQFAEDGGAVSIVAQHNVTGAPEQQVVDNWLFRQGLSSIDPISGNAVFSKVSGKTINTAWWARPDFFDQGIATFGGGDVSVVAVSGNVKDVSASTATNAFMPGSAPGALVERGGGDLFVKAGGDIAGGSFYTQKGLASIAAGGSITSGSIRGVNGNANAILALGDAQLSVTARNNINIDAIYNPTLTVQSIYNSGVKMGDTPFAGPLSGRAQFTLFSTYSDTSSVSLTSAGGNVQLNNNSGNAPIVSTLGANAIPVAGLNNLADNSYDRLYDYLPATFNVVSMNGNITSVGGFTLAGAPNGELNLLAGGSISLSGTGRLAVAMSDISQSQFPSYFAPRTFDSSRDEIVLTGNAAGISAHTPTGLHSNDAQPVRIIALNGDIVGDSIQNDTLNLPKLAEISAGHDILNLGFTIQQSSANSVTTLTAGNNITDSSVIANNGNLLEHIVDGPGRIDITAGHTIDLGDAAGVVTKGNLDNPYLVAGGAGINLTAGTTTVDYVNFAKNDVKVTDLSQADQSALIGYVNTIAPAPVASAAAAWSAFQKLSVSQQQQFLNTIKPDLNALFFTDLVAASKIKGLTQFDSLIATLFPSINPDGGDINVFASQLKTIQGGSIYMFTPGGSTYAGLPNQPTFLTKQASDEGIFTIAGGAIAGLVHNNFEVDQGRVFSLDGGDITLVSQYGDLSAGKGTKSASSAPPPLLTTDQNGNTVVDISGSIAGSGIGTLQAYPNAPVSNIYVVAPRGVFDAGDAGVRSTGSVDINALVVLNAGNIVAAGAISGVPTVVSVNVAAGVSSNATPNVNDISKNIANSNSNGGPDTTLSVDVLGYGSDSKDSKDGDAREDDGTKKTKKL